MIPYCFSKNVLLLADLRLHLLTSLRQADQPQPNEFSIISYAKKNFNGSRAS